MTTYTVPTTKANKLLEESYYVVASDEAEAVAMACGEYLVTGIPARVVIGENGLLNALDAIITLSQLQEIPIDLIVYSRDDEPQHKMVTDGLEKLIELYNIKCTIMK